MSVASIPSGLAERAGRINPAVRALSVVILALLVAAVGVFAYLQASKVSGDQARQQRESAALAAAKTEIARDLSYDYRHLSANLATAEADTTGEWSGEFRVLAAQEISPLAAQQKTVTRLVVADAAVQGSTDSEVTVLVLAEQSTTNATTKTPQRSGAQMLLTMQDVGGRWLIEKLKLY